jgi:RHS repeat-associated protein
LKIAAISSTAASMKPNWYKFNAGTEFNNDLDINFYETNFRTLDPQLGRFWQVDPLAEYTISSSVYTYCENNPIAMNDPLGLKGDNHENLFDGNKDAIKGDGDCVFLFNPLHNLVE